MQKLVVLSVLAAGVTAASRPLDRIPHVQNKTSHHRIASFDEEQSGGFNLGANNGGWNASVNQGGFSGSVSGGWNGGRPTYGVGYQGNLGGGQFNAGVSKGPGGYSAGVGYTLRFEEELDDLMDAFQAVPGCVCVRAPCPC